MQQRPDEAKKTSGEGQPAKKPYQKPAFRCEKVFETTALACGKVDPTQLQCRTNTKQS